VKRTVIALTGLAALAGLATLGGQVVAQPPAAPGVPAAAAPAAPRGKVGVVNINKVIKGFNKANTFGQYLMDLSKHYATQRNTKQALVQSKTQELQKTVEPTKKQALEDEITKLTREMQDIERAAEKDITDKQGAISTTLFKEMETVIASIAKSYDLELVLSYPDATTDAEANTPAAVFRKMSAPAALPIYVNPSIDITDAVVKTLNVQFPAPPPAQTSAAPGAPPAGGPAPAAGGGGGQ
jgi:Skp family chaperone for outer membrane proteins